MRSLKPLGPDLLAILSGVAIFSIFYGPEILSAKAPYLSLPVGDIATEMAGYFHFVNDSWRFPIFIMPNINQPEGSNALFTGGVPLLALIAKIIQRVMGTTPNLFGVWYLLCCALQTHSLFFLMRQITDRRPFLLATASIVAGLTYAFLTRTGHVSLFCQFFCIYAVAFVIATTHDRYPNWTILVSLAFLVFSSMLVFAYLAICNTVLFFGAVVSLWWLKRLTFRKAAGICAMFFFCQIAIAFVSGYFWAIGRASPSAIIGFPELGLNLGSLFSPPKSVLFPNNVLIPPWWEGDFYLGLGVIGLWLGLLIKNPLRICQAAIRHWPISLVLVALATYSFSNRIAFLNITLMTYPLPSFLTPVLGMARTAGRLFWPAGYLIIAGAFALTVIEYPRRAPVLVFLAIGLAGLEATGTYAFVRGLVTTGRPTPLNYSTLENIMSEQKSVFIFPTYWCNDDLDVETIKAYQQIELTSARAGLRSNSSITARKIKDCEREFNNGIRAADPGSLLILMNERAIRLAFPIDRRAEAFRHCMGITIGKREGTICSMSWVKHANGFDSPFASGKSISEPIEVGEELSFSNLTNSTPFLISGWSPEAGFAWTDGLESTLEFQLPPSPSDQLTFAISFFSFNPDAIPSRTISIFIGNIECTTWTIRADGWETRDVPVPSGLDGKPIQVTLRQSDVRSPKDLGISDDPRHLGIAVKSITLEKR
ncbi:MAG: DUF6311 domain-containing protein [Limisphaerales bacterium]